MIGNKTLGILIILLMINFGKLHSQELVIDELQRIQYLIQMENFEKAIEFSKKLDDSLFCEKNELLGFSYKNIGNYSLAINHYKTYIEQCNPSYIQRINLGDAYFKIDSLDSAEKQFKEVIKSNPKMGLAYFNIGQIEYIRNNKKEAADFYLKAVNNTGSTLNFDYVEMMIQTLIDLKDYEKAIKFSDEVIGMWEQNTNEYKYSEILKAMIYGEMGEYEKAIKNIDDIIATQIEHPAILLEAYSNKLRFFDKLKDKNKACLEYDKIKNIDPNAPILKKYDCK
ncbi:tetratricopeptide repeat protein [Christiangramia gaetbulicola]|nr:tetratricopeptide repeat protein [Christiangramia gaetbulicola]